jgi:FKBP-type peptidyl-prolyl cis-trans isomerase 2
MSDQNEQKVAKGDTISVYYTGTLDDGSIFDSNVGKEPLKFKVGSGELIKGFDEGVVGMKQGEEKDVHITAKDAYGDKRSELVMEIPAEEFGNTEVKVGMGVSTQDGHQGRVIEVSEKEIKIDFNSELAGKDLNFKIKVAKIEKHG